MHQLCNNSHTLNFQIEQWQCTTHCSIGLFLPPYPSLLGLLQNHQHWSFFKLSLFLCRKWNNYCLAELWTKYEMQLEHNSFLPVSLGIKPGGNEKQDHGMLVGKEGDRQYVYWQSPPTLWSLMTLSMKSKISTCNTKILIQYLSHYTLHTSPSELIVNQYWMDQHGSSKEREEISQTLSNGQLCPAQPPTNNNQ